MHTVAVAVDADDVGAGTEADTGADTDVGTDAGAVVEEVEVVKRQ